MLDGECAESCDRGLLAHAEGACYCADEELLKGAVVVESDEPDRVLNQSIDCFHSGQGFVPQQLVPVGVPVLPSRAIAYAEFIIMVCVRSEKAKVINDSR